MLPVVCALASPIIDPSFHAELPRDVRAVEVVAVAPDDRIVVNLWATAADSPPEIMRLFADGRRDPAFKALPTTGRALASFPDLRLIVAQPPYRLAADGSPLPLVLPAALDSTKPLDAALVLPDGRFFLAQDTALFRFNTDGSVDPTFAFDNVHGARPYRLQLDAQNRVLADIFYQYYGAPIQTTIRLLSDGHEDNSFTLLTGGYRTRVRVYPLSSGDYLEYSNFEGGQRLGLLLRTSDSAQPKGGMQPPMTSVDPVVDRTGRIYFINAMAGISRSLIVADRFVDDAGFSIKAGIQIQNAYMQPNGEILISGTSVAGNTPGATLLLRIGEAGNPYLANLSGRGMTGTGENTIIAGLVTQVPVAAADLPLLLRGAGPALRPLGVTNFLPDPVIDLHNSSGTVVDSNDQWSVAAEAIRAAAGQVGAFPFSDDSNDAALLHPFASGTATIMLDDHAGGTGVGLLEIYRIPGARPHGELLNLSFRASTGDGEATAIAGFVIVDPQSLNRPARVLLRAVGPSLGQQGIVHPLENPILTVYNAKGEIVAKNDDWPFHLTAEVTEFDAATKQAGAFPLLPDSKDAALLVDLPAGAYTMHANGGEGIVLLEIYLVR